MAINESIWGAPATWVTYTTYAAGEVKTPVATIDSYYKQWSTGGIPTNENDVSPCFWGVGKDSIWSTPYLVAAYAAGGDLDDVQFAKRTISTPKDMPLLFTLGTTSSTEIPRFTRRYKPDAILSGLNNNFYTFPVITSFNYQKTLVIPVIRISKSDFSTTQYVTLHSYLNNPTQMTQYPYIVGIAYYMYLSEAGTRTANSYVSGLRPYMFRDIDGSIGYESKLFFARSSGISYGNVSGANNMGSTVNSIFAPENGLSAYYGITTPNATVSDPDTAIRYKYSVDNSPSDGSLVPIYYIDDNWKIGLNGSWRCVAYLDTADFTIDEIKEYVFKQIAYLGLPFVYDYQNDYNKAIGDTGIYLPVFDANGVTTGDYVEGAGALELPNAEWTDGRSSGYDPNRPPTPENGDYGDLNNLGHNRYMGKGLNVYVMPTANYTQNFLPALNGLYQNSTPDDWTIDFQGENPSNYIVAAFNTFFAVPTQGISTNIMLGVVDTGISADVYDRGKPQSETFTYGTRRIEPLYYDFRDYAPYTNIELYLPLCGTIPLETAYVMGHDITINYWYDITTMSCTACVYRDNLLYKTLDGSLGVPAPLLASDMGNYQNQIKQLENAKTQNNMRIATSALSLTAGIAAAVASGGTAIVPEAMGIAGGLAGMSKAIETANEIEYKIDHAAPSISTTGASESQNNMCVGQLIPKLIIKRPVMLPNKNDTIYSKTVGNACCINNSVGDNNGLIKCSNVDLSGITATAAEISAIQNLLTSGVYV